MVRDVKREISRAAELVGIWNARSQRGLGLAGLGVHSCDWFARVPATLIVDEQRASFVTQVSGIDR